MDEPQLEQNVRELLDRDAITELIVRLGLWLDNKQFEDAEANAALFMPDITLQTPGGEAQGLADVVEQARRHHQHERTQHVLTNVLITLGGERAAAEANLIATFVPKADNPTDFYQVGTHYNYTFVRTASGWRFASIRDKLIWRSRPPKHMKD